jgi:general stress protein YciG
MKSRIYLGRNGDTRTVFQSDIEPTAETHGELYDYAVGPFRTMRAALYMRDHPYVRDVGEAERLSKAAGYRSPRGFAAMDPARHAEIAGKGGRAAHEQRRAHEFTRAEASAAGRKGGEAVSRDRAHMAEIGRKGGAVVSQDREHMASIGRVGGLRVAEDVEHMRSIGRRGGQASGGVPRDRGEAGDAA